MLILPVASNTTSATRYATDRRTIVVAGVPVFGLTLPAQRGRNRSRERVSKKREVALIDANPKENAPAITPRTTMYRIQDTEAIAASCERGSALAAADFPTCWNPNVVMYALPT